MLFFKSPFYLAKRYRSSYTPSAQYRPNTFGFVWDGREYTYTFSSYQTCSSPMTGWMASSYTLHVSSGLPSSSLFLKFCLFYAGVLKTETSLSLILGWDMEVRYNDSIPRSHVISFTHSHTRENSHSWGRRDDNGKAVSVVVGWLSQPPPPQT